MEFTEFLAGSWLIWLIVALVSGGYLFINQRSKARRILDPDLDRSDSDKVHKAVFTGFVPMVFASIVVVVSFIFLIIGIVATVFPG